MNHIETLREMHDAFRNTLQAMQESLSSPDSIARYKGKVAAFDWALSLLAPENADGHVAKLIASADFHALHGGSDDEPAYRAGAAALIERERLRAHTADLESSAFENDLYAAEKRRVDSERYVAEKKGELKLRERIAELEAQVLKWQRIRTPTHGACCTCQRCGLGYDECRYGRALVVQAAGTTTLVAGARI